MPPSATSSNETDLIVLLDESGRRSGTMPRDRVHTDRTPLHLAFSVYLLNTSNQLLMTRRSLSKLTWPGVWSNSCCGHVHPDEDPAQAAERRVGEELGITAVELKPILPD